MLFHASWKATVDGMSSAESGCEEFARISANAPSPPPIRPRNQLDGIRGCPCSLVPHQVGWANHGFDPATACTGLRINHASILRGRLRDGAPVSTCAVCRPHLSDYSGARKVEKTTCSARTGWFAVDHRGMVHQISRRENPSIRSRLLVPRGCRISRPVLSPRGRLHIDESYNSSQTTQGPLTHLSGPCQFSCTYSGISAISGEAWYQIAGRGALPKRPKSGQNRLRVSDRRDEVSTRPATEVA